VTGPGGIGLAGWYIPAASGLPPDGPTVVLVHGWGSNKSALLDRAAMLHGSYNLLLLDLRNHGQSGEASTTQGVREAGDLRAMLDWLEASKGPERVAVLGVSMGGATALVEATRDDRVDAVIAESTHASIATAIQTRLERAGYPLAMPGSWAVLLGSLMRTGVDVSSADPIQAIDRLDGRPVLLLDAGQDDTIGVSDAVDMQSAGEASGSAVELVVCDAAGHGAAPEACPEAYAAAVLGFLERALAGGG
jgi:pimeloyl-ACP methyl ester carboxylesterase